MSRRRRGTGPGAIVAASIVWAAIEPARAHVEYVTDTRGTPRDPLAFLVGVLSEPINAAVVIGGGVAVALALGGYLRARPARRDVAVVRSTLHQYVDLVPWLLRLSMGLPLVGAGFAGYFFTPAVPAGARLFQVTVGFLLLFGLATRFVAALGLLAYLAGLAVEPTLFLAGEYLGGLLAVVLLGSGRPSADQLLWRVAEAEDTIFNRIDPIHGPAERITRALEPYEDYAATIVRISLGLTFVFLGLSEKLLDPGRALVVVDKYDLTTVVPIDPGLWVVGVGLTEIALGTVLVIGLFTRAAAGVALLMFTLTLFGLPDDPVLAHVTLFGLVSALFITGSGPLAVDNWIHGREPTVETTASGTTDRAPEGDSEDAA